MESRENTIKKEDPEFKALFQERNKIISDLEYIDEDWIVTLLGRCSVSRVEKYLKDNFDLLSEQQKQYALISLRLRTFRK